MRELRGRGEAGLAEIEGGAGLTERKLLETLPAARFWVEAGVGLGPAGKLVRAGFPSLESLAGVSRDELLAIPGVGIVTVQLCERLLGRRLPSVIDGWQAQGFSGTAAASLAKAGIESVEALARLTDQEISAFGLRSPDRQLCQDLLGRRLQGPKPPAAPATVDPKVERSLRKLHQQILLELVELFPGQRGTGPAVEPALLALWEAGRVIEAVIGGAPRGLDLTAGDTETGEALYEWVVRHHFALRVLDAPGDVLVAPHTPEECQLKVQFTQGRWFATWVRLDVAESQPEVRRRALVLFETGRQGELVETAV